MNENGLKFMGLPHMDQVDYKGKISENTEWSTWTIARRFYLF